MPLYQVDRWLRCTVNIEAASKESALGQADVIINEAILASPLLRYPKSAPVGDVFLFKTNTSEEDYNDKLEYIKAFTVRKIA